MFEFEIDGNGIDFGLCVSTGQVFRWRQVQIGVWEGVIAGVWWRVRSGGDLSLFPKGDGLNPGISRVQLTPHPFPSPEREGWSEEKVYVSSNRPAEEFVGVFGVNWGDKRRFGGILGSDPGLGEAVKACAGLRVLRQDDPVEVLFSFLCSANNHVKRIEGMVGCLAEFGEGYVFPTLEVLARVEGSFLRTKGFGYRSERISACASQVLELGGLAWLEDLRGVASEKAVLELQRLPGVGPKVAECVALFGLGHGDVVPIDTHIWNAVRRRYFPELEGGSLTLGRRRLVGDFMRDRFGGDAGLAHLVLFVDEMRDWRSRR